MDDRLADSAPSGASPTDDFGPPPEDKPAGRSVSPAAGHGKLPSGDGTRSSFSPFAASAPQAAAPKVGMVREIEVVHSDLAAPARPFNPTPRPPFRNPPPSPESAAQHTERDFSAALHQSKEILAAARSEAEKIVRDAEAIVQEERGQARKRGLEEGRIEAAKSLLQLSALRDNVIAAAEREILEIASAVAEEVIGETLKLQPESIVARVKRAANFALNAKRITLAVSPADIEYVRPRLEEIQQAHLPALNLAVREDPMVGRGDARLETDISVIDSSVAAHIAAIRCHLKSLSEEAGDSKSDDAE